MFDALVNLKSVRKRNSIPTRDYTFENPIIHREIRGDKIFVPLDMNRAWNK